MGLNTSDDFDSFESSKISENTSESSEQYREKSKKIQSQLKRIQKDENSAKNDNQKLFLILSRCIQDPYYEKIIPNISDLLSINMPSRGVIAFISLFYPDAAYFILDALKQTDKMSLLLTLPYSEEQKYFDEKNIDPKIQKWLTQWIVMMEQFLIQEFGSLLMTKKMSTIISGEQRILSQKILTRFIVFFFTTRHILISEEKAGELSSIILKNLSKTLNNFLQSQESSLGTLLSDTTVSMDNFFWQ